MAEGPCPVWAGHLLANPLRKLFHNPRRILAPYVREAMTALDAGSAMGFFSLPLAQMVGGKGRVVCVDMQAKMLEALERRARRAGLADRIETRVCAADALGLDDLVEAADFALAFAVVHEVPDAGRFFAEIYGAVKRGGRFLFAEPKGHVSLEDFETSVSRAVDQGFTVAERLRSHAILLVKEEPGA